MTETITMDEKRARGKGIEALQAGSLTPKMVLFFCLVIAVVVSVALLIVWTRNQVVDLGYQISAANEEYFELKAENRELFRKRYKLINLDRLQNEAPRHGLGKHTNEQLIIIYDDAKPNQAD